MRLSRQVVEAREAFVRNLFADDPTLPATRVNARLVEAGLGRPMAPRRLYALRALAAGETPESSDFRRTLLELQSLMRAMGIRRVVVTPWEKPSVEST